MVITRFTGTVHGDRRRIHVTNNDLGDTNIESRTLNIIQLNILNCLPYTCDVNGMVLMIIIQAGMLHFCGL